MKITRINLRKIIKEAVEADAHIDSIVDAAFAAIKLDPNSIAGMTLNPILKEKLHGDAALVKKFVAAASHPSDLVKLMKDFID